MHGLGGEKLRYDQKLNIMKQSKFLLKVVIPFLLLIQYACAPQVISTDKKLKKLQGEWVMVMEKTDTSMVKFNPDEFQEKINIEIKKEEYTTNGFKGNRIGISHYEVLTFNPMTYSDEVNDNSSYCILYAQSNNLSNWIEVCDGTVVSIGVQKKGSTLILSKDVDGNQIIQKYIRK